MRRELPAHPHIDHLKKQAKELLAAHRRGEPDALARIRDALPAFAGRDDAAIAKAPFALHDAQSSIAREYGFASWKELSAAVDARRAAAAAPPVSPTAGLELLAALMRGHPNAPLPGDLLEKIRTEWSAAAAERSDVPVPAELPLLAVRNALVLPDSVFPLQIGRAASIAAIDAAASSTSAPGLLALFAQRDANDETPRFEALHGSGCLVRIVGRLEGGFVIVKGLRFIDLVGFDPPRDGRAWGVARVRAPTPTDDGDADVGPLFDTLRERARELARPLEDTPKVLELIEGIQDPDRLANLLVANLPASIEDKARFAAESTLAGRLRAAIAMAEAMLGTR
jgi:hypothetical protein